MFYFRRDVWEIKMLNLPKERMGYEVPDLDFSRVNNKYNKKMLKKFIGSQIRTREIIINTIYHKLLKISIFLCWLDKDIREVTFANADDYSHHLSSQNLTDAVYNEYIFTMREFMEYIRAHTPVENYFKEVDCRSLYPRKPRDIDNKTFFNILSKLEKLPLNIRLMFFILYAGLPIYTMLQLERDCLEQSDNIYKLRFCNSNHKKYDYIKIPKNLYLLIEYYLRERKIDSNYLFPYSKDSARSDIYVTLRRYLMEILDDGESGNFRLSDFKNAFLFRLFYHGVPLLTIRSIVKIKSFSALSKKHERFSNSKLKIILDAMQK